MKKPNQRKIKWILGEMERGELSVNKIARIQKITPRWARELYRRYKETSQYPYPRKPGKKPKPISEEDISRVLAMKNKHPLSGALTIEKLLDREGKHIPHNRIHRILKEKGLAKSEPKKQKRRKWIRYERKHTNSLWHTDWFENVENGNKMILYEDDASRFIPKGKVFSHATAENSKSVLKDTLIEYYKPKQVISDHGTQFTSLPRKGCLDPEPNTYQTCLENLGIKHIKSRVNHPQSNGKVERAGGTIRRLTEHFGSLDRALEYYNFERPHWSLNIDECETPFKAYIRKMWPSTRRKFLRENIDVVSKYAPEYLECSGKK